MKSSHLTVLVGLLCLLLGAAPLLAQFMECANYTYKCPSISCMVIPSNTGGSANNTFNAISQNAILLGNCNVGSGSCSTVNPICTTQKFMTDPYAA